MMNNFDKNIQELLKSHTEQPSVDCWNRINTQLDMPQMPDSNTGSSSSASSSGGNASAFSQFVGSITGKIVSAVVAAAVVGGVITWAVVHSLQNEPLMENESAAIFEDTQNDLVFLNEEEAQPVNENTALSAKDEMTALKNEHAVVEENKDTAYYADNKAVVILPSVQDMVSASPVQSETENTAKVETVSKTENKPQPTNKEKEPKKSTFADNKKAEPVENISENELSQNIPLLSNFTIPTAFTPNGDNVNDYFVIEGIEQFSETHLYIYSRNGAVVYEKSNYKNNWGAENLPDGVYYYMFTFVYQGLQSMRNGSITVRR